MNAKNIIALVEKLKGLTPGALKLVAFMAGLVSNPIISALVPAPIKPFLPEIQAAATLLQEAAPEVLAEIDKLEEAIGAITGIDVSTLVTPAA